MSDEDCSDRRKHEIEIQSVQTDVHWLKEAISRLERSVGDIGKRQPMLPIMMMFIAGFGVVVTLGVQALSGQSKLWMSGLEKVAAEQQTHEEIGVRHKHQFLEHIADGHSPAVRNLLDRVENELTRRIGEVDTLHTSENIEQENDIQELREGASVNEKRVDGIDVKLSRLEVVADERTERFKSVLNHRDKLREMASKDRWTGAQEREYQRGHQIQHEETNRRLRGLEGVQ